MRLHLYWHFYFVDYFSRYGFNLKNNHKYKKKNIIPENIIIDIIGVFSVTQSAWETGKWTNGETLTE